MYASLVLLSGKVVPLTFPMVRCTSTIIGVGLVLVVGTVYIVVVIGGTGVVIKAGIHSS